MGALVNAASLLDNPTWRGIIAAAALYQARIVVSEAPTTQNHELRERLAREVLVAPATVSAYLVPLIATDPDVATTYSAANVETIPDNIVVPKVAALWNQLANYLVAGT